jgi:hypothetical protein
VFRRLAGVGEADEALLAEIGGWAIVAWPPRPRRGRPRVAPASPVLVVDGAQRAVGHADEIAAELRVKAVAFEPFTERGQRRT